MLLYFHSRERNLSHDYSGGWLWRLLGKSQFEENQAIALQEYVIGAGG
ncbi:hypothetical protein [Gimesia alba]|nr:hypothetical protein [Gimesia alba]